MKKGFTLIELLAVILILGIIALIAIPTVNNIIKESRRGAFNSTLTNLGKAVEEKCTLEQIKNQEITTLYTISNGEISPSLDIKGELPNGTIIINRNCEVSFELSDNNFTGTKDFYGEIVINEGVITKYKDTILNGADPIISGDLIPVTIANDGTVKKADISKKWYDYENKEWANAVILTNTGKVENDGTIKEDSIESYFVWVPRYKYKVFNMGNYDGHISGQWTGNSKTEIDIVFENKSSAISVATEVGQYHTHPAFIAFDANGLWFAKFESTGTTNNVTIKPNNLPLVFVNTKTSFELAYNYDRSNNSHMMKNTEWGAVLYLSHSKYGVKKLMNINNFNTNKYEGDFDDIFRTGYSSVIPIDDENYSGANGTTDDVTRPFGGALTNAASTTGNITGIYDIHGSAAEFVAAYVNGGNLTDGGFTSDPASTYGNEYFDVYPSDTTMSSYSKRILGDAIGEIGPIYLKNHVTANDWYGNIAMFIDSSSSWLQRGSAPFAFTPASQAGSYSQTFRIVLVK